MSNAMVILLLWMWARRTLLERQFDDIANCPCVWQITPLPQRTGGVN